MRLTNELKSGQLADTPQELMSRRKPDPPVQEPPPMRSMAAIAASSPPRRRRARRVRPVAERSQDHLPGGLGDRAQLRQLFLVNLAQVCEKSDEDRDQDQREGDRREGAGAVRRRGDGSDAAAGGP
ncbi:MULTISPECIES: hypothetical protein [unclassified Streptomyces]|uniref:hypothetical protein n=1 Tax=unclassified Streptomyces TaxID=2593676 RepID=UPI0033265267